MNNKRGFLLAEETLKIILSVIAIGFLIYFLASLYYANKGDNEMELAQASLEHLIDEIEAGAIEVVIYNPKDWMFSSWPSENKKPDVCDTLGWEKCVCICDEGKIIRKEITWSKEYRLVNHCNQDGFCLESEGIKFEEGLEIEEEGLNLNIEYNGAEVVVGQE